METTIKAVPMPGLATRRANNEALVVIGVFKMVKAVLFLAAALGMLRLVHRETKVELVKVLRIFRISQDRHFVQDMLGKADVIDDSRKQLISGLLAFYALLFATEGTGLIMRKRWGEYFTSVITGTGIPIELYALIHRTTESKLDAAPDVPRVQGLFHDHVFDFKIAVLLLNVAILWFLVANLIHGHKVEMANRLARAGKPDSAVRTLPVAAVKEAPEV